MGRDDDRTDSYILGGVGVVRLPATEKYIVVITGFAALAAWVAIGRPNTIWLTQDEATQIMSDIWDRLPRD